jgi:4'-phosphopantetheinyl transferase
MLEQLGKGHVHVWIVPLDMPPEREERIASCLSAEERERRDRITLERERSRFAVSRGALRVILGHCAGRDASALRLRREALGKPRLQGLDGLEFSVSHSRDVGLVAVAGVPVGVDVEYMRQPGRIARTASRVLHAETMALLDSLVEPARTEAFLAAWTLREAHVKAIGGGMFRTPDALPFDPAMPDDGTIVHTADRSGTGAWSIVRFAPAPGARASLVAQGNVHSLHVHGVADTDELLWGGNR